MSQYTEARKRISQADEAPARPKHSCAAAGCPMAGSMAESSHSTSWWCAYHYACHPSDLARVTSVLNQHHDLRDIVNHGRHLLTSSDVHPDSLAGEWQKLRELLAFGGYDDPKPGGSVDTLNAWLYRVEAMLGGYVSQARGVRRKAA